MFQAGDGRRDLVRSRGLGDVCRRQEGLIRGDTIAVFLENRPELLAVVAGAAKVGVACAMLNTSQKGRVLEHSINLVSPKTVPHTHLTLPTIYLA